LATYGVDAFWDLLFDAAQLVVILSENTLENEELPSLVALKGILCNLLVTAILA